MKETGIQDPELLEMMVLADRLSFSEVRVVRKRDTGHNGADDFWRNVRLGEGYASPTSLSTWDMDDLVLWLRAGFDDCWCEHEM